MSAKTLIIKTGASGDVVRTTSLLPALEGEVFWLTAAYNLPLFPETYPGLTVAAIENIPSLFLETHYDLVLSLEEDARIKPVLQQLQFSRLTGVYWGEENSKPLYTEDARPWFDLSLISRYGKDRANELKKANKRSFQEHLFGLLGKEFKGERYQVYQPAVLIKQPVIGLEKSVGRQWPNKQWSGYDELQTLLEAKGHLVRCFEQRGRLRDYMEDIASCQYLVTGDTLAMHLGLAYRLPVVGIFNCTSPQEIYGYDLLQKVVSPLLSQFFYQTTMDPAVMNSVTVAGRTPGT